MTSIRTSFSRVGEPTLSGPQQFQAEPLGLTRFLPFGFRRGQTLAETIEGHENNYTIVRVILSASVIYFHSFLLTNSRNYTDYLSLEMRPITDVGRLAVQMFFFLSGLFVAQSFHKHRNLPGFVVRRAARIWPGYFICLVVTVTIIAALKDSTSLLRYLRFQGFYAYVVDNSAFNLKWTVDGLLSDHANSGVNGSIHTLPMEAKMYVVLACIGALGMLRGPRRTALAAVVAIALAFTPAALRMLPFHLFDAQYSRTAAVLFLVGVTVYGLAQWIKPALWQGALLIPFAFLTSRGAKEVCFFASCVWVILLVGQSEFIGRLGRPRQDLSYGIYLYGWPSQQIVLTITSAWLNPYILTALSLPLAAGFAVMSWRFVEKPAMAFGAKAVDSRFGVRSALAAHPVVVPALAALLFVFLLGQWSLARFDLVPLRPMATQIVDFGPKWSRAGESINQQPNGDSAIWLKLDGTPGEGTSVVMAGRRLETVIGPGLATARVDPAILARAGDKLIFLERRTPEAIEHSSSVVLKVSP